MALFATNEEVKEFNIGCMEALKLETVAIVAEDSVFVAGMKGRHISHLIQAEGNDLLMNFRKNGPYPFAVKAEEGGAVIVGNMIDKFRKGAADIFHTAVMVQMIIFHIGHYGQVVFKF